MEEVLSKFQEKKVLVVGDICLDRYRITDVVYGSSREGKNIPTLRFLLGKENHKDTYSPGAGGNVAWNLSSLGAQVSVLGVIGDDYNGYILKKELQKRGVNTDHLIVSSKKATVAFEKSYDSNDMSNPIQRWDAENKNPLGEETENKLIEFLKVKGNDFDAIVIADHCEIDETTAIVTERVLETLTGLNTKVFGFSRNRIHKFKDLHLIVPNDNELARATKIHEVKSFEDEIPMEKVLEAGKSFHKDTNSRHVITTIGRNGAIIFNESTAKHIPTTSLTENIDICGCGDTFISTLILAEISGADIESAVNLANKSAGLTAKKLGTTGVSSIEDLINLI
jgi:D-glycero-beta-D-manno-heptose-7-phosphate kinase